MLRIHRIPGSGVKRAMLAETAEKNNSQINHNSERGESALAVAPAAGMVDRLSAEA